MPGMPELKAIEERTIALAGMLQACQQVQTLARTGEMDSKIFDTALQSILVLDAVNTAAIYGGLKGVSPGLALINIGIFKSPKAENIEVARYAVSMMHLQSTLYNDRAQFAKFAQQIERLSGYVGDALISECSAIYKQFISGLRPQIIVQGEQGFLQREDVPDKVRALLLATFRSAVLWQQKGGTKFKFVWQRTRMQNAAQGLIKNL